MNVTCSTIDSSYSSLVTSGWITVAVVLVNFITNIIQIFHTNGVECENTGCGQSHCMDNIQITVNKE